MSAPRAVRWILPAALVVVWLAIGGFLGPYAGKLGEVTTNEQSSFLPSSAESTQVLEQQAAFESDQTTPAIVVWEARDGRITADQRAAAGQALESLRGAPFIPDAPSPAIPSEDGAALSGVVPVGSDAGEEIGGVIDRVRAAAEQVPGTSVQVGGPAATQADFSDAFAGIDTLLVLVALGVVLVILLLVYRSVLLPLLIIVGSILALGFASAVAYALADAGVVTVDGQVQGILSILVIGATTDYALLMSARFREELSLGSDRLQAMRTAWRRSAGAILASGGTVAAGLLALLLSDLSNNRALGPVGALGIGCALLSALTYLPAVLVIFGRTAYWPARPHPERPDASRHAVWERIARLIDHHPRRIWAACLIVLLAGAAFMPTLRTDGVPLSETFVGEASSVTAQEALDEHFPGGSGNPAIVITDASALPPVLAAAQRTEGVSGARPRTGEGGRPVVVDGRAIAEVTLSSAADSDAARRTVDRLRGNLHGVAGADALVGGYTAQQVDTQAAAQRDRKVIIPVVLAIIIVILVALLRSVLMPVLLVATVALNYLATLGVAALVFQHLLGFTGTDPSVALYGFVFLVALGVDYNIFLMTRAREESLRHGVRRGVLEGLTVTGGVITSAGVVLAATFAALVVIPLSFLVQIAFIVAFGVLMDTLLVRSLLVPALVRDAGPVVWWPGVLYRRGRDAAKPGVRIRETVGRS
ncbi:MMPL family transporter [Actinomadura sp. 7K534]|uniref:MMPL family transporter n=1 Tax=Actinomadura sp. 7K534 TaxID=2530366 RepID=UPI001049A60F|nr:MMPL family transporter [Actinomadura sp. 7K534]TDB95269.1 MMPL family transporter [Actinomadura sp. 7K534]